MLRKLHLENCMRFSEKVQLDFDKNTHYCFGENDSGRRGIFNAFRTCLSFKCFENVTCLYDPNKPAYVACEFQEENAVIYACTFYAASPKQARFKLAARVESDNISKVGIDLIENADGVVTNTEVKISTSESRSIVTNLKEGGFIQVLDTLLKLKRYKENPSIYDFETDCEKILLPLCKGVLFLMEIDYEWKTLHATTDSASGEVQWNIQDRKEVITWFLKNASKQEKEMEKEIFSAVMGDNKFEFQLHEDEYRVLRSKKPSSVSSSSWILEAKVVSVVLAMSTLKTICLQGLGRDLDLSSSGRLHEILHMGRYTANKCILISSHNVNFVNSNRLSGMFLFRRIDDSSGRRNKIVQGKSLIRQDDKKAQRIFPQKTFADIIFSRRILFVEGTQDRDFVKILIAKMKLLDTDKSIEEVLINIIERETQFALNTKTKEEIVRFLSSLTVIPLDGSTNAPRYQWLARELGIEHFFLLDNDTMKIESFGAKKFRTFFGMEHSAFGENWSETRSVLRQKCIFIWETGSLDSVVVTLECEEPATKKAKQETATNVGNPGTLQKKFLEDEHVNLPKGRRTRKKTKARDKPFANKELTLENIERTLEHLLCRCKDFKNDLVQFIVFLLHCSGCNVMPKKDG